MGLRAGPALVFLIVTLAVALGTSLYLVNSWRDLRSSATRTLTAVADLKSSEVARWFKERHGDASLVRGSSVGSDEVAAFLAERPGTADTPVLLEWMAEMRASYSYATVALYDQRGAIRLSSGAPAPTVSRAALERALTSGLVVFDDLDKDDGSGARHMSFLAPIGHHDRTPLRFTGVIALVVDARAEFYPMLRQFPLQGSTGEIVLARQDGDQAVFLLEHQQVEPGARTLLRRPIATMQLVAANPLGGRSGAFEGVDYRGNRVLAAGVPVAGTPWVLLAKQDLDEVEAPFRVDARRASAVGLLLLLTTGFGPIIVSRRRTLRALGAMVAVQRERQASDERLRSAMSAALDAFIILDANGRIVEWNRQAELTFGWTGQDAAGQPFQETALVSGGLAEFEAALAAGRSGQPHPILGARRTARARRRSGEEFPAEITLAPIRRREDTSFSAVVRDITDRVATDAALRSAHAETRRLLAEADEGRRTLLSMVEDQRRTEAALRDSEVLLETRVLQRTNQLEAANLELEAFSYSVSHDLRAPLRAIDGYARILADDYSAQLGAEGQRRIDVVQREARRMGLLIDDLLRFSRVGRQPLSMQRVDMTAMVREVFAELRATAPNRDIELALDDLPAAMADPGVIRQVWVNLIGNALKFTGTRPLARIEIGASESNGATMYFVRDNGVGFDMKYGDKLFGVFQWLHASADFEGTGVGLALSQRIVLRHGGRMWAEGAVDHGATFSFSLPVDAVPAAS